jgi:hypothetical protein
MARAYTAGDINTEVSIQSISKVFTMAQVIQAIRLSKQSRKSVLASMQRGAVQLHHCQFRGGEMGYRDCAGTGKPEMNALGQPRERSQRPAWWTGNSSDADLKEEDPGFITMPPHWTAAEGIAGCEQIRTATNQRNQGDRSFDCLRTGLHQRQLATGGRPQTTPVLDRQVNAKESRDDAGNRWLLAERISVDR